MRNNCCLQRIYQVNRKLTTSFKRRFERIIVQLKYETGHGSIKVLNYFQSVKIHSSKYADGINCDFHVIIFGEVLT